MDVAVLTPVAPVAGAVTANGPGMAVASERASVVSDTRVTAARLPDGHSTRTPPTSDSPDRLRVTASRPASMARGLTVFHFVAPSAETWRRTSAGPREDATVTATEVIPARTYVSVACLPPVGLTCTPWAVGIRCSVAVSYTHLRAHETR